GLLLSSLHAPGGPFVESLSVGPLPILTVTRHADAGLPFVGGDDRRGGALAARHLLDRGYRDIAVIAGPGHATTAGDRVAGFLGALAEASIGLPPERVVASAFDVAGGVEAGRRVLDRPDPPMAVFSDSRNIRVRRTCTSTRMGF